MRSREAAPALLYAACCHEHHSSTPNMPPAGLCSSSWCQVCWTTSATPPCRVFLMSIHPQRTESPLLVQRCHVLSRIQLGTVPARASLKRPPGTAPSPLAGSPLAASHPGTSHGRPAVTCPCSSPEIAGQTAFRHTRAPASATRFHGRAWVSVRAISFTFRSFSWKSKRVCMVVRKTVFSS